MALLEHCYAAIRRYFSLLPLRFYYARALDITPRHIVLLAATPIFFADYADAEII